MSLRLTLLWVMCLVGAPGATAQPIDGDPTHDASTAAPDLFHRDAPYACFLLTLTPGPQIWERFGHTALVLVPRNAGWDQAIMLNWGTFDMAEEGFVLRFVRGRMTYRLVIDDERGFYRWYVEQVRSAGRDVILQHLDFTPAQLDRLITRIDSDWGPGRREFRYDYYTHNCSTIPRDLIDHALGGQLRQATDHSPDPKRTFRWHTNRMLGSSLHWVFLLNAAMGTPIDRPLTNWQQMFLPDVLSTTLDQIEIDDGSGGRRPLVGRRLLAPADDPNRAMPFPQRPPQLWPVWWGIGLLLMLGVALPGQAASASGRTRVAIALLANVWGVLVIVAGLLMSLCVLLTDHWAANWNPTLLALGPLTWPAAILLPGAVRTRRRTQAARRCVWLALITLVGGGVVVAGYGRPIDPAMIVAACVWTGWAVRLVKTPDPINPIDRTDPTRQNPTAD